MNYLSLGREVPKPPDNIEAEAALLGAILCENSVVAKLPPALTADHFFEPLHSRIYEIAADQIARGIVATPVTLKPLFEHDPAMAAVGGVGSGRREIWIGAGRWLQQHSPDRGINDPDFVRQFGDITGAELVLAEIERCKGGFEK